MDVVYHFSEDPTIERFVPHVPATNPANPPTVWAIDLGHSPLYWFPRQCPRVTAWPRDDTECAAFEALLCTTSHRVHAVELAWLDRIRSTSLFRYRLDRATFCRTPTAGGYWVSDKPVEPVDVEPVGDLIDAHVDAGIELRAVPSLWPLHDLVQSDRWDFSIVRMQNAEGGP